MSNITPRDLIGQLVKGGGISILIKVANAGLAYVMLLAIANVATAEQYGIFAVAFSIAVSVSFISTVGQQRTILRFWPQWMSQNKPQKARAALKLSMIATAVGLSTTVVFMLLGGALPLIVDVPWTFGLAGATALFGFALGLAEFSAAGLRAQEYLIRAQAPRDIGWRILVCLMFGGAFITGMSFDAETIVLAVALALFVMVLPQTIALVRSLKGTSLNELLDEDRKLIIRTSSILWALSAFGAVENHIGIIIVSTFLGTEAAGAFFIADRTANLLSFFLLAINLVVAPHISKYYHSDRLDMVRIIVALSGVTAGLAALCGLLFFVLFGTEILALFDASYASYLPILFVLALGQLVRAATGPVGLLLNLSGYERINLILLLTLSPAIIALQVVGGLYFGAMGVAVAAAGGTICSRLLSLLYTWRVLGIDPTGISLVVRSLLNHRKVPGET